MSEQLETTHTGTSLTVPKRSGLVIHKSFMYNNQTKERLIYRGGRAWEPETDEEFIERFTSGDVALDDLDRCCRIHPIIVQYNKRGLDYYGAIYGTINRVAFPELFARTGFSTWGVFRSMTEYQCPGLKALFLLAQQARDQNKLIRAEAALEKRAIDGVDEEVYAPSGKFVGTRKRYSDKLLEIHLKALDPARYADTNKHSMSGTIVNVNMNLRDPAENLKQASDIQVSLD